ncbi:DUF1549 domain-containing protein [Rubritalea tangerina]|uniref:DUF1549 domain-containing protein n=2 Tax=Rubritalea tangerina TaxID=430798 RepID=A0ABW4ZAC8_9BACT
MATNSGAEIDYIIESANKEKGINPNPIIDDATFLRRAYLSIIGRIPTMEETKSFLQNTDSQKRTKLIDQLVYSPGFSSHLFNFYANMLRVQSTKDQFGLGWQLWLRDSVEQNKPYDKLVYEMLSASGHCSENPAVGYYLRDRGMLLDNVSNTAKVFLGTQIGCAQCHDHPFEDWTQKQYYQLAAFGAEIDYRSQTVRDKIRETVAYKRQGQPGMHQLNKKDRRERQRLNKEEARDINSLFRNFNNNAISKSDGKSLKLPDDYKYNDGKPGDVVTPNVLFGSMPKNVEAPSPHAEMGAWITSRSNPMFSKVYANRLWKHALGYGLVEPIDNWTDRSNIAHPDVLDTLVQILHATDFDTRETLRVIFHTKLFQRAMCDFEIRDGRVHDFRGPLLRRMSAEQIYDSLLTLEKGNVDGQENLQQRNKWASYTAEVNKLLTATPQEIIKLDNQADRVEDATRDLVNKSRTLRSEIEKARKEGNKAAVTRGERELKRNYQKINEIRQKIQEEQKMEMSMMTMRNNLRVKDNKFLRASEMATPFRPGSFARDFGASDRVTTDAQHTHASIPQALVMLNGRQIEAITGERGSLAKQMKSARLEADRLNLLYLSIYNCYPTREEQTKLKYVARSRQDIKILAKAMLNSKRFLFIQ